MCGKRNQSNKVNREVVKDYENKLAAKVKSDSKNFYKYVRSRQRKKDRVGPITDNKGRVLIKDEEVAKAINKYFGSVYEKEEGGAISVASTIFKGGDEHQLRDVTFTKERVIKELEKLRMDKSPGIDAMHPKIIKELKEELGEVLADIMRKSMITGDCINGPRTGQCSSMSTNVLHCTWEKARSSNTT